MKNYGMILGLLLAFIMSFCNLIAQTDNTKDFLYLNQTCSGTTIPYRLFIPKNYDPSKKYPIILALHGAGECGIDNKRPLTNSKFASYWADSSIQTVNPCFIIVPQCPYLTYWYTSGHYDDNSIGNPLEAANSIIETLISQYNIDKERLYAIGYSMGGLACWELASRYPNRFAAIVPICGTAQDSKVVDRLKTIPIWIFSGQLDDVFPSILYHVYITRLMTLGRSVVFTQCRLGVYNETNCLSNDAINDSIDKGANLFYTEYPDLGHSGDVMNRAYNDSLLSKWLFKQKEKNATSVSSIDSNTPDSYFLYQNYPNPFNPTTEIKYQIPNAGYVTIKVFDIIGKEIAKPVDEYKDAGHYRVGFNANNLPSGVYLYSIQANGFLQSRKMILIK